jgi:sulfite reductase (NADPH) hemoprotein beta-component
VEAILRVYNRYGRRDNKYKARIKILVRAMTPQIFREKVDAEWEHLHDGPGALTDEEILRVKNSFVPPTYANLDNEESLLGTQRLENRHFDAWVENNVDAHKQTGYAIVTLSTKTAGIPPGDVTDIQMDAVAHWSDKYGYGEIRISHEQNFVLPDVRQSDLLELFVAAKKQALGAANVGLLTDVICCPGGDYCSLANAKSIPVAEEIQRQFDDYDYLHDLGPLDLNISGCMNACGHHHVGHIGILGVDKKGAEFYQISLGGHAGNNASLGKIIGPSFSRADVTGSIVKLLDVYIQSRAQDETFLDCYRRIGMQRFKESVYANAG